MKDGNELCDAIEHLRIGIDPGRCCVMGVFLLDQKSRIPVSIDWMIDLTHLKRTRSSTCGRMEAYVSIIPSRVSSTAFSAVDLTRASSIIGNVWIAFKVGIPARPKDQIQKDWYTLAR